MEKELIRLSILDLDIETIRVCVESAGANTLSANAAAFKKLGITMPPEEEYLSSKVVALCQSFAYQLLTQLVLSENRPTSGGLQPPLV